MVAKLSFITVLRSEYEVCDIVSGGCPVQGGLHASLLYTMHDIIMLRVYTCIYRSFKVKTILYSYETRLTCVYGLLQVAKMTGICMATEGN